MKGAYLILTILLLTSIYLAVNSFVMPINSENLVSQSEKLVEIAQYDDNYGQFLGLDFEEDIMVIASNEGIIILNKSLPDSLLLHKEIKGNVKEVKIQNETIFGLNSSMLMSYNLSKGSGTELLDNYLFQDYPENLQLWGECAFVVDGGNLSILNISDPKNMQSITSFSIPDNNIGDYAVDGERLYVLDSAGQMRVVDISNITKPTESEIYQDVESEFYRIRINNNYAYLIDNSNKFVVLNISDISNITQLSESGINDSWVERIFVENNFAYVLSDISLNIINVTDATSLQNITKLSAIELGITYPSLSCLEVSENYLYLIDTNRGVFIIDISTINVPQLVSEFSNGGMACQVCLQEDYLYLADGDAGLEVFDITNISQPQKISQYQSSNSRYYKNIIIEDGYGYLLDFNGYLEIVSITDGDEITSMGNYHQPFVEYYDFILYSQYLIIAAESTGIVIFDISSKTNPQEVETIFDGYCYYSLAIDGNNLYTISVDGISKMKVYDFSNPANPQLITEYLLPDNIYWRYITINEDRACITSSDDNMLFLDISSPNNPKYIGEYRDETLVSILTVQLVGGYLCTGGYTGINIFDIKEITDPQKIAHYYDGGVTFGMELKDNYFYIADGYDNLEILETSIQFYFQFKWNAIIILLSILGAIGISTIVFLTIRKRR